MVRVAVFDDFRAYAEMAAAPLKVQGHQTLEVATEEGPVDWERVLSFGPQVISVGLYRKRQAFNRPVENWEEDVLGYQPLKQMVAYPAISIIPIVLVGSALEDFDVPTSLNYDLFLTFPDDIHLYAPKVIEMAETVKTRRKISAYACPHCRARLVYVREPAHDLFCPRCGTSVAIVTDADPPYIFYIVNGEGPTHRGPLDLLERPSRGY